MISDRCSKAIYLLKAVAIFFVVCAHSSNLLVSAGFLDQQICAFWEMLGTLGVPIFFVLSGYLMLYKKIDFVNYWKKKLKRIVVPWIFTGTAVYLYVTIRKGGLSFIGWLNYLTNTSYLYYLTVLVFFYLVYSILSRWQKLMYGFTYLLCAGSIVYLILFRIGAVNGPFNYLYVNPFHWAPYFCLGILIRKHQLESILWRILQRTRVVFAVAFVALTGYIFFSQIEVNYFNWWGLLMPVVVLPLVAGFAGLPSLQKNRMAVWMGKNSFCIYLIHMPVAGAIVNIFSRYSNVFTSVLRPFAVLFVVCLFILLIEQLAKKISLLRKLTFLIGIN